jgi:hypothetical protein
MLLAVALSSGFPLPTKIVKEGILFPSIAARWPAGFSASVPLKQIRPAL